MIPDKPGGEQILSLIHIRHLYRHLRMMQRHLHRRLHQLHRLQRQLYGNLRGLMHRLRRRVRHGTMQRWVRTNQ